jgi:hypothetical protein
MARRTPFIRDGFIRYGASAPGAVPIRSKRAKRQVGASVPPVDHDKTWLAPL